MIGIKQTAIYEPEHIETAKELEYKTGIPEDVIIEKFGLIEKRVANEDEHASDLAIKAGEKILKHVDPDEVDVLIYFGSPHKDYQVWSSAPRIQHHLKLHQAYAFELMNVSSCFPIALKVARDMMRSDDSIRNILLVGGCKESQIIDYDNPRSRFMFNFADGGAAALIGRNEGHEILQSGIITDGSFSEDVYVPAGGTVHPASEYTLEQKMHYIDVPDPQSMKERLDPVSIPNFIKASQIALEKSNLSIDELDWLLPLHTKKSMFDALINQLQLNENQTIYLKRHGHMSALDPCYGLYYLGQQGVKKGDIVLALSAGTGYTWSATAIKW
ncbi:3-oxoacyl-ACP synthase [Aquisalibacillus elongatus]|uniref:3-oxoacyl-[acyl-carrier-protein] synthase-3 n=1 Tax=Aquisalibacillus elongatus TaxID=485577 RepID=A0A3N5BLM8_9BACI|nr:3-oxoacyl-ACP synthase [Aquisalibacillus elongatus]RPF50598.1 3-oxoacyl-[acyl-carrier-protein] synthase-3 [Aquisalibacillus elongatus]